MALEEKKTVAEQQIWKRIEELEQRKEKAEKAQQKIIEEQIKKLKQKLSELTVPEIPKKTCIDFKEELEKKSKELEELKERHESLKQAVGSVEKIEEKQKEKNRQFKLYKFLLEKYEDLINDSEKKTIGEIKGLVDEEDLTIQSILSEIKPQGFEFKKDYLNTAKKALEFINSKIECVDPGLGINFWLSPKEILELKVSDDEDLAVLLCSVLAALGDEKAFVVIAEMDDLSTHAFVITELNNKFFIIDPCQEKTFEEFSGEKTSVLQKYSFNGAKIKRFLYKFNNKEYEQFLETE